MMNSHLPDPKSKPPRWQTYQAINMVNGKVYYGKTCNWPQRINDHRTAAANGKGARFGKAIRKHGWDNFEFFLIERYETKELMDAAERRLIGEGCTQDPSIGYNTASGGEGLSSEDAREIHRRPSYRGPFLERRFRSAAKAKETRARNKLSQEPTIESNYGPVRIDVASYASARTSLERPSTLWSWSLWCIAGAYEIRCGRHCESEVEARESALWMLGTIQGA